NFSRSTTSNIISLPPLTTYNPIRKSPRQQFSNRTFKTGPAILPRPASTSQPGISTQQKRPGPQAARQDGREFPRQWEPSLLPCRPGTGHLQLISSLPGSQEPS